MLQTQIGLVLSSSQIGLPLLLIFTFCSLPCISPRFIHYISIDLFDRSSFFKTTKLNMVIGHHPYYSP